MGRLKDRMIGNMFRGGSLMADFVISARELHHKYLVNFFECIDVGQFYNLFNLNHALGLGTVANPRLNNGNRLNNDSWSFLLSHTLYLWWYLFQRGVYLMPFHLRII